MWVFGETLISVMNGRGEASAAPAVRRTMQRERERARRNGIIENTSPENSHPQ
jgi:hypothetical protein